MQYFDTHDQVKHWFLIIKIWSFEVIMILMKSSFLESLNLQILMATLVGNKRLDIHTSQRDAEGINGKKRVIDVRVTNDIANDVFSVSGTSTVAPI